MLAVSRLATALTISLKLMYARKIIILTNHQDTWMLWVSLVKFLEVIIVASQHQAPFPSGIVENSQVILSRQTHSIDGDHIVTRLTK